MRAVGAHILHLVLPVGREGEPDVGTLLEKLEVGQVEVRGEGVHRSDALQDELVLTAGQHRAAIRHADLDTGRKAELGRRDRVEPVGQVVPHGEDKLLAVDRVRHVAVGNVHLRHDALGALVVVGGRGLDTHQRCKSRKRENHLPH